MLSAVGYVGRKFVIFNRSGGDITITPVEGDDFTLYDGETLGLVSNGINWLGGA